MKNYAPRGRFRGDNEEQTRIKQISNQLANLKMLYQIDYRLVNSFRRLQIMRGLRRRWKWHIRVVKHNKNPAALAGFLFAFCVEFSSVNHLKEALK